MLCIISKDLISYVRKNRGETTIANSGTGFLSNLHQQMENCTEIHEK